MQILSDFYFVVWNFFLYYINILNPSEARVLRVIKKNNKELYF